MKSAVVTGTVGQQEYSAVGRIFSSWARWRCA